MTVFPNTHFPHKYTLCQGLLSRGGELFKAAEQHRYKPWDETRAVSLLLVTASVHCSSCITETISESRDCKNNCWETRSSLTASLTAPMTHSCSFWPCAITARLCCRPAPSFGAAPTPAALIQPTKQGKYQLLKALMLLPLLSDPSWHQTP